MKAQENVLKEIIELCETAIEQDLLSDDDMEELESEPEVDADPDDAALAELAKEE